jgi:hypothetical protein
VRDALVDQPLSRHEQAEAHRTTRYRELLEAFSAYASACLYSAAGKPVVDRLREDFGVRPEQLATTALGVYSNAADVREYLQSVGFSEDEIDASYVTRDSRLAGRVTIPWRDPWGNLRTVVAHDLTGKTAARGAQLFLKGSSRPDFFGLDVALRAASAGKHHLLLVNNLLEVVVCHARGLCNVAASGSRAGTVTGSQWQTLSSLGVRRATLTLDDEPAAWRKTHDSLTHWLETDCQTQPFSLACGALGTTPRASGYIRSHGNDALVALADAAPHGCTYLAGELIRDQQHGPEWSDGDIVDLLSEAVELDRRVTDVQRSWAMERFFWPTILAATRLDWQDVRGLLERRQAATLVIREQTEKIRKYKLLAADLTAHASVHDLAQFEKQLLAAADEIRHSEKQWSSKPPRRVPMPVLPPIPAAPAPAPPAEDHWQETIVEAPPISRKRSSQMETAATETESVTYPSSPTDDSIRRRAYRLWEKAGHPAGQHLFFWQEAERQLLAEAQKPVESRRG